MRILQVVGAVIACSVAARALSPQDGGTATGKGTIERVAIGGNEPVFIEGSTRCGQSD